MKRSLSMRIGALGMLCIVGCGDGSDADEEEQDKPDELAAIGEPAANERVVSVRVEPRHRGRARVTSGSCVSDRCLVPLFGSAQLNARAWGPDYVFTGWTGCSAAGAGATVDLPLVLGDENCVANIGMRAGCVEDRALGSSSVRIRCADDY
jgi:hypothetical protein